MAKHRARVPEDVFTSALVCAIALTAPGCASPPADVRGQHERPGDAARSTEIDESDDVSVAGVTFDDGASARVALESIALRVHDLNAMTAFYRDAFGVAFHQVETFGVTSHFGELDGITLKLVPIRESADFVGFPDVQLGFEVPDIDAVLAIAKRHGGRQDGQRRIEEGLEHAGLRDPDGNTIELYQRRRPADSAPVR